MNYKVEEVINRLNQKENKSFDQETIHKTSDLFAPYLRSRKEIIFESSIDKLEYDLELIKKTVEYLDFKVETIFVFIKFFNRVVIKIDYDLDHYYKSNYEIITTNFKKILLYSSGAITVLCFILSKLGVF